MKQLYIHFIYLLLSAARNFFLTIIAYVSSGLVRRVVQEGDKGIICNVFDE